MNVVPQLPRFCSIEWMFNGSYYSFAILKEGVTADDKILLY
jgi:hypothetical protein